MATIRERTKQVSGKSVAVYHVQVRKAGYPTRTATFPTKRLAERWAVTIEAEMIEGRHFKDAAARRHTVADAIDRYIREELPQLKSHKGRANQLQWWRERIGDRKLSAVSTALIVECKGELATGTYSRAKPQSKHSLFHKSKKAPPAYRRSGETVDAYLVAIARVFSIARREWQWTNSNPAEAVSKFGGKKRIRHLVEDEQERLLAAVEGDPQLRLMVILALSTAPRAGELINLEWRDVDLDGGQILLRQTKNGDPRAAWLHGRALESLREWHESHGKPTGETRVFSSVTGKRYRYEKPFKAALDRAGIKNFRFHDLRHSSATYLARMGATEQQLKAIGGWKSNVVSRYVHLAAEDAKAIVQRMNEKMLGSK
jgi:integrase